MINEELIDQLSAAAAALRLGVALIDLDKALRQWLVSRRNTSRKAPDQPRDVRG
ncbi:hypothetical protein [Micromonospora humi]|uniref:Uncharacterized protein n=1 Tax=Micromonospora humi TaxID=745366 RepID=A0A1C5JE09_9ACTN|nr:hypothetical protein [Micromonospora humi]SCG68449.1 hypothetical protein GA0070213_110102 [Micromonospora humi]